MKKASGSLSKQEIFDKVKAHLLNQMERASEFKTCPDTGWAMLVDKTGRKSAVGILLGESVDKVNPHLGLPLSSQEKSAKIVVLLEDNGLDYKRDKQMLFSLESMHNSMRPEMWDTRMRQIAKEEGLLYDY